MNNNNHVFLTGNNNFVADLNNCNSRFTVDLTDVNSNLPTFVHSVKYKGKVYRIKVNGASSPLNRF